MVQRLSASGRRLLAAIVLGAAGGLAAAQGGSAPVDQSVALEGQHICLKRSPESVLPELCIDFRMNVRLRTQTGEPVVHGSLAHWSVSRAHLRAPNGRVMPANEMGPEVQASLDALAIALTLDVPVFSRIRQENDVLLRVDGGSSVRQGRKPMSSPGSPDWSELLHIARPTLDVSPDAPLGRWTCQTDLAPTQRLSGDSARQVVRERGFRFMGPERFYVCENMVDIFGTEAVSAAIVRTCEPAGAPAWCGKKPEAEKTSPQAQAKQGAAKGEGKTGSGSAMDRMLESRTSSPPPGRTSRTTSRQGGSALDRLLDEESRAADGLGRLSTPVAVGRPDDFLRAVVPQGSHVVRGSIPRSSPGAPVLTARRGSRNLVRPVGANSVAWDRRAVLQQDVLALSARCDDTRPVRAAYVQVQGGSTHLKLPLPANARCGHGILLHGPDAYAPTQASGDRACLLLAYEDQQGRVSEPLDAGCAVHARLPGSEAGALEIHMRAAPLPGNFDIALWGPGTTPREAHRTVSVRHGSDHTLWFKDRQYRGTPIRDGAVYWTSGDTNYIRLRGAPDGDYHLRFLREGAPEDYDVYAIVVRLNGQRVLLDEGRGRLHSALSGGRPKWLSFRKQGQTITRIPSPVR